MHLSDFIARAESKFPDCIIKPPATSIEISSAEERMHVKFPQQVHDFYQTCNGIYFPSPFLEILPLDQIHFVKGKLYLKFCIMEKGEVICFDTSSLNEAGQWFIKGLSEDFIITFTMASFWSNKVWNWLEKQSPKWRTNSY